MNCPDFVTLIDYVDGQLVSEIRAEWEEHLSSGCKNCNDTLQWYAQVKQIAALGSLASPPTAAVQAAYKIFTDAQKPAEKPTGILEKLWAVLCFDSFQQPQLVGARNAQTTTRQLLFRAGNYDIDLMMELTSTEALCLRGQIISQVTSAAEQIYSVTLRDESKAVVTSKSNDIGEFFFAQLPPQNYQMYITASGTEIYISLDGSMKRN